MKPSQHIPFGKVDDAYDKLHAEHERLKALAAEADRALRRIVDEDEIKTPWQIANEYLERRKS